MGKLDLDQVTMHKPICNACGHNSRPELLWLDRDSSQKSSVRGSSVVQQSHLYIKKFKYCEQCSW